MTPRGPPVGGTRLGKTRITSGAIVSPTRGRCEIVTRTRNGPPLCRRFLVQTLPVRRRGLLLVVITPGPRPSVMVEPPGVVVASLGLTDGLHVPVRPTTIHSTVEHPENPTRPWVRDRTGRVFHGDSNRRRMQGLRRGWGVYWVWRECTSTRLSGKRVGNLQGPHSGYLSDTLYRSRPRR